MAWLSKRTDHLDVAHWMGHVRGEKCEHIENDKAPAVAVLCEDDGMGPGSRYCVCQACYDACNAHEQAEKHFCCDCKTTKPLSEGYMWTWYDFYAAQGDEALFVCNACWGGPAHKERQARDRNEEEAEEAQMARRRGDYVVMDDDGWHEDMD